MAGARISFDTRLDDAAAQERLARLVERLEDKTGFLKTVGEELLYRTQGRFDKQTGPDGTPWKPLARGTIRARERKGQTPIQILTASSVLSGSINLHVGNDQVTIGTPKDYAAIHQFGGTINKPAREGVIYRHVSWKPQKLSNRFAPLKGRKEQPEANLAEKVAIKAHEISMPARPFLGFSAEDQAEVIRIASDWLGE